MEAVGPNQAWGFTPALDLLEMYQWSERHAGSKDGSAAGAPTAAAGGEAGTAAVTAPADGSAEPLNVLIAGTGDIRHILKTLAQRYRHSDRPIHFYFHERTVEAMGRAMLLLSIALDWSIPLRRRVHLWLEVFGNTRVQERTARFLDARRRLLIDMLCNGRGPLAETGFLDFSCLRFRERDALEDVVKALGHDVDFDVDTLRDQRLRHHYGTRYDFRRNLIDWDLQTVIKPQCGIVHPVLFRLWRESGVAFEFGDETYTAPNRSLASYAEGRQRGLSVELRGFWGDVVNSPYHAVGTRATLPPATEAEAGAAAPKEAEAEDPAESLFEVANRHLGSEQFRHTPVDIAVFNLLSWLSEIETREIYRMTTPHDMYSGIAQVAAGDASTQLSRATTLDEDAHRRTVLRAQAVRRARHIAHTLSSARVFLMAGPLPESIGRTRYHGLFDVVCLGAGQAHVLDDARLWAAMRPRAMVVTETARNMVVFKPYQRDEYERRVVSMAGRNGAVFQATDRDITHDRCAPGSHPDARSKAQRDEDARARARAKREDARISGPLGEHGPGLVYLRRAARWDLQRGDNPRPEHLVFRWDAGLRDGRVAAFAAVLKLLAPMSLKTKAEAEAEAEADRRAPRGAGGEAEAAAGGGAAATEAAGGDGGVDAEAGEGEGVAEEEEEEAAAAVAAAEEEAEVEAVV